jgi:hypothetical protein
MDQAGLLPALLHNGAEAVFLAEGVHRADELNRHPVLGGPALGVLPDLLAPRFGDARVVEQAQAVAAQPGGHARGVADPRHCAHDHDPIVAGHHARDLLGVARGQQRHGRTLLPAPHTLRRLSTMSQHTPVLVSALPS